MINVNQRIQGSFGDIYTPNTSHTDRLAQQFYVEQKQREAQERQMQDALDNEFSKNLTGIRDIDTDDLTKAYGDFKLANKSAMRQRDGVSPKQQMELLKKKAAMYDIINKSKTQKALEDDVLKGLGSKDRDNYEDNAHQTLAQSRATPLSKLGGLYGYDYSYKGGDYDLTKALQDVTGDRSMVIKGKTATSKDGAYDETPVYQTYKNDPETVKRNLLGKMGLREAAKGFVYNFGKIEHSEVINTNEEFNAIPEIVWKDLGIKKPELSVKNPDNKYEQAANYYAQKVALEQAKHILSPIKTERTVNVLAKEKRAYDNAVAKMGVAYVYAIKRQNHYRAINGNNNGLDETKDLLDSYTISSGEKMNVDGVERTVVPADKVDMVDIETIGISPYTTKGGKKVFVVDDVTGDFLGGLSLNTRAKRQRVNETYRNTLKSKQNYQLSSKGDRGGKSTIIENVKSIFKGNKNKDKQKAEFD